MRLVFEILHIGKNAFRNRTPVMIFQLLTFGGRVPEQRPARLLQIIPYIVKRGIYQKILLFPA